MTSLDELAIQAQAGEITMQQLVEAFLDTVVMLPSAADPMTEGVKPVLVKIEDLPHLVVATGEEGLKRTLSLSTHAITISGRDVFAGLQPGSGVLVNTAETGFSLHPKIVAAALEEYNIVSLHDSTAAPAETDTNE